MAIFQLAAYPSMWNYTILSVRGMVSSRRLSMALYPYAKIQNFPFFSYVFKGELLGNPIARKNGQI